MTETVILPPDGRRHGNGRFIPPLLLIPFVLYHIIGLTVLGGRAEGWAGTTLFNVPMVSGASWSLTWSDLLLVIALICLFFEVVKSTNTGRNSVVEHMASTALFVMLLIEFLLFAPAASSTFFILMAMALVDVVAGFTISITGAGRDVTMGS